MNCPEVRTCPYTTQMYVKIFQVNNLALLNNTNILIRTECTSKIF